MGLGSRSASLHCGASDPGHHDFSLQRTDCCLQINGLIASSRDDIHRAGLTGLDGGACHALQTIDASVGILGVLFQGLGLNTTPRVGVWVPELKYAC